MSGGMGGGAGDPVARADRHRPGDRGAEGGSPSTRGPRPTRERVMVVVNGILAFVVLMVILQLWLLTATMNAYLAGDTAILLPAAVASAVCFALNLGLLWYLYRLER
jgi:hypothetical protein